MVYVELNDGPKNVEQILSQHSISTMLGIWSGPGALEGLSELLTWQMQALEKKWTPLEVAGI